MDLLLVFETLVCMRMLFAIKRSTHTYTNGVRVKECRCTLTQHTLLTAHTNTHTPLSTYEHLAQIIYIEI